jgi:hypothetical protein
VDGNNWEQLQIPTPGVRHYHSLVHDPVRARTVLFGGEGNFSGALPDSVWEFDGLAWTQVSFESGPGGRTDARGVFDPISSRCVFWCRPSGDLGSETWAWDGTAWEQLAGIDDPFVLAGELALDPVTNRLVLYATGCDGCATKTYSFDGAAWTLVPVASPPKQFGSGFVTDTARGRIVKFSGHTSSLTTKMWEFKGLPRAVFTAHPQSQSMRLGSSLNLAVAVTGPAATLRWHRNGAPLFNGGRITGATTTALTILSTEPGDSGVYTCVATGTPCTTSSAPAQVNIWCFADLSDNSGSGTPDNAVDISDLLFFLAAFESGSTAADLDNGSSTGTPDGGVDVNDLLFFLARFEAGC